MGLPDFERRPFPCTLLFSLCDSFWKGIILPLFSKRSSGPPRFTDPVFLVRPLRDAEVYMLSPGSFFDSDRIYRN